jgi:hypothetical protein
VAYACLVGCLSSIDETLCSLQGELASLVEFDACFDLPWFRGSMVFCIEKPCAFLATLLSLKLGVAIHIAWFEGGLVICLGLRGSWCFFLYVVCFALICHFLHTHLSHFASHVILAWICLIMLITVLG